MTNSTLQKHLKIIRIREVMEQTGLGRSTVYALAAEGMFPRPIKLGVRASGWNEGEIQAWLSNRILQRDRVAG